MSELKHVRARWPDAVVPDDSPEWLFYELDQRADVVKRMVEVFPDGSATRNSIEIEERIGPQCPSLFDVPLDDAFRGIDLEAITSDDFEQVWATARDTPFWNAR